MALGLKGLIPFPPQHFPQRQNCIEKGFDLDCSLELVAKLSLVGRPSGRHSYTKIYSGKLTNSHYINFMIE